VKMSDVSFLDKTPSEILARYGTCVSEEDTPPSSRHTGIYLQLHTSSLPRKTSIDIFFFVLGCVDM
jgi:hypothetical protein